MKSSLGKIVGSILLFGFILLGNQENIFAQTSLDKDPATQGSVPYEDAVKRFLDKKEKKIVGGLEAPDGAFPWQVSLGVSWIADPYYAHFCGGSILAKKWIITAAHCLVNLTPSQVIITAGTNRLVDGSIRQNVQRIILNKNYNRTTKDNDIALIELYNPLPDSNQIQMVSLITPSEDNGLTEKPSLTVVGWGATKIGGMPVVNLRFIDKIPFVSRTYCNEPLSYNGRITENMICAGFPAGGKDSCQGDSGGPLTIEIENAPRLAGIVSWGEGCALPDKPGVYTRVAKYTDWVNDCVSNSDKCNK